MKDQDSKINARPYIVRLPGFMVEKEIGLGDIVKRVTSGFGVNPCSACEERATALNRLLIFTRKQN